MLTPAEVVDLLARMRALAAEIMDPLICRSPAYGAPGRAHCAACCYGTGYVVTCYEEQAMYEAAQALEHAADAVEAGRVDLPDNQGPPSIPDLLDRLGH